jgi:hypothetical protein
MIEALFYAIKLYNNESVNHNKNLRQKIFAAKPYQSAYSSLEKNIIVKDIEACKR